MVYMYRGVDLVGVLGLTVSRADDGLAAAGVLGSCGKHAQ
jgi:hypothetical protein